MSDSSSHKSRGVFAIPLIRELAVVLIIKLVILYFIWFSFFSEPVSPSLTSDSVGEAFLGSEEHISPPHNNRQ